MVEGNAVDRVIEALGHRYRRRLLAALTEHNPQPVERPLNAETKLESVTGLVTVGKTSDIAIVHTHLPKLETLGYVTWDESEGAISKGPDWDEIEPTIQLLLTHGDELGVEWL